MISLLPLPYPKVVSDKIYNKIKGNDLNQKIQMDVHQIGPSEFICYFSRSNNCYNVAVMIFADRHKLTVEINKEIVLSDLFFQFSLLDIAGDYTDWCRKTNQPSSSSHAKDLYAHLLKYYFSFETLLGKKKFRETVESIKS